MATAADVDLRGWTVQGSTPRRDGNYPASSRSVISLVAGTHKASGSFPLGVMFDASDSSGAGGVDAFESFVYDWDYDDAGSTFTNAPDTDATTSRGAIGAHVYTSAGTYNPSVTVTDRDGNTETASFTVTVTDPLATFDDVYYISTSSTYPGGVAADKKLTTYAEFATEFADIRANQNGRSKAFLFRAGETFTVAAGALARENDAPIYVGSYDTGAKPIISPDSAYQGEIMEFWVCDNVTVTGLDFSGVYDTTTGLGAHPVCVRALYDCTDVLVYDCDFSNIGVATYLDGESSTTAGTHMLVDCNISDWQNYGAFGSFGELSCIVGNYIKQNINAVSGTEGKVGTTEPNYPDHGCVRASSAEKFLVQNNDMFNNCGWSSEGRAHQACVRMGTATGANKSIVSDNLMEGGFSTVVSSQANPSGTNYDTLAQIIWERNTLTSTSNGENFCGFGHYGHIVRNNMFYKPDNGVNSLGYGQFKAAISLQPRNVDPAYNGYVTNIYNKTFISQSTESADTVLLQVLSDYTDFEVHNNIVYLAASSGNSGLVDWYNGAITGIVSDNNIIYSPSSTNYADINGTTYTLSGWQTLSGEDASTSTSDPNFVSNTSKTGALNVGSPAIDNAKDLFIKIDDLSKTLRSVPYNIGASE